MTSFKKCHTWIQTRRKGKVQIPRPRPGQLFFRFLSGFFQDPLACAICGQEGPYPDRVCPTCLDRFCYVGAVRLLDHPGFEKFLAYSGYFYNNFLKDSFSAYKFEGASYLKPVFSRLLLNFYDRLLPHLPKNPHWLAYVPSYPSQEVLRGYNVCFELGKDLAKNRDLVLVQALDKVRKTQEQNKLSLSARAQNIQGSLAVSPRQDGFKAWIWSHADQAFQPLSFKREQMAQSQGFLLDDFLTSGATMQEALSVLHGAGFKAWGLTLGVARMPDDDQLV